MSNGSQTRRRAKYTPRCGHPPRDIPPIPPLAERPRCRGCGLPCALDECVDCGERGWSCPRSTPARRMRRLTGRDDTTESTTPSGTP